MTVTVERCGFDSDLFGYGVGRIDLSNEPFPDTRDMVDPSSSSDDNIELDLSGTERLLREAETMGLKLVYLFAPILNVSSTTISSSTSSFTSSTLSFSATEKPLRSSFYPGVKVDTKTTLTVSLQSLDRQKLVTSAFLNQYAYTVSSPASVPPTETLEQLAVVSGEWSRFRVDSNIPRSIYESLFRAWMKNSVNRSVADEVFVAIDTVTKEEIGMITLKKKGNVVHIGLLAVSGLHRRKGLASMLLSRGALWALEQLGGSASGDNLNDGIYSVVTQGANEPALQCYKNFGFTLSSTQDVYHVWLPQHLPEVRSRLDQAPIPFCKQYLTGKEIEYVSQVFATGLDSAARFTQMCTARLRDILGSASKRVVIVPSGTAALEMAALLAGIENGDEVIMPSYTFSSTANAFVLRGAIPVFVDVRRDTVNIDETLIEAAITSKTKAICVVHYGGVACEMDTILAIAEKHNLFVIEDAAQAFQTTYKGRPVGTLGHFGCFSFHYTKNVICGEGGAISINRSMDHARRSLTLWEKGTNRYDFMQGKIDKYEWVDLGSSYVPSEISCAILLAQLEHCREITAARLVNFHLYKDGLRDLEERGILRTPCLSVDIQHNGHIFFIILPTAEKRIFYETQLKKRGISAFSHYVPLHAAPAGKKFARAHGCMDATLDIYNGLLRLPVWVGLKKDDIESVIRALHEIADLYSPISTSS